MIQIVELSNQVAGANAGMRQEFSRKSRVGLSPRPGVALGFGQLEIESDPNAEGFYRRLGARRVGSTVRELEQQRRELPILIYEIDRVA